MMVISRQLEEILSWRFVAEFWRRFPNRFILIEAHPGSGQYDALALVTKEETPRFAIDVNRGGGSVHIHKEAFGLGEDIILYSDWLGRMLQPSPAEFLDVICKEARLVPPKKLSASTPTTIVYRFIADFLAHSMGKLEKWECRSGYEDTSGYGGRKRQYLFDRFTSVCEGENLRKTKPFLSEYAYSFWFLIKNGYIRNSQRMIITAVSLYSTFRYIHTVRNFDGMCAGISTSPAVK